MYVIEKIKILEIFYSKFADTIIRSINIGVIHLLIPLIMVCTTTKYFVRITLKFITKEKRSTIPNSIQSINCIRQTAFIHR